MASKTINYKTPDSIKGLFKPQAAKATSRKVWSIDLSTVWIPFYTAANVTGDAKVSPDALGAPLRLAKDKDGVVRFSQNGEPVLRVNKELSDQIRLAKENFEFGLVSFAVSVQKANPDGYREQVAANMKAALPIHQQIVADIDEAIALRAAEAEAAKAAAAASAPGGEEVPAMTVEDMVGESEKELVTA